MSFALIFIADLAWAGGMPLAAVPDEPAHSIKAAAVVRGELLGEPTRVGGALRVRVPRGIAESRDYPCFAFNASVAANCRKADSDPSDDDETVAVSTSAGTYNPVYYAVVGLPTLVLSGDKALYAMRAVSAFLVAVLWALGITALARVPRARWVRLAALGAVTPMTFFLGAAVNPNGVEVASAFALFGALLLLFSDPDRRSRLLASIVAAASGVILVNGRSIAAVWLVVVVLLALPFIDRHRMIDIVRKPATWIAAAVLVVGGLSAAAWLVLSGGVAKGDPFVGSGSSPLAGFIVMIGQTFDFAEGYIGVFGWLERPAPAFAYAAYAAAVLALLVTAAAHVRGRVLLAFVGSLAALVVAPAIIQAVAVTDFGYIWQGRYSLALFVVAMVVAGAVIDRSGPTVPAEGRGRRAVVIAVVLLAAAQGITYLTVMHRFVSGDSSTFAAMLHPVWQPPGGWVGWTALFAASILVGAWAGLLWVFRPHLTTMERHPIS